MMHGFVALRFIMKGQRHFVGWFKKNSEFRVGSKMLMDFTKVVCWQSTAVLTIRNASSVAL